MIIGVLGLMGSGKGELTDHLKEKYGFVEIVMSDVLREMLENEGIEYSRENLQKYREEHGKIFLIEFIIKRIKENGWNNAAISGMRMSEDVLLPKKEFGSACKIILVEAYKQKRFERLLKRGSGKDPKTMEELEAQEKREFEIFDFDKSFSLANIKISNNGSLEEFREKIDELMKKIGGN